MSDASFKEAAGVLLLLLLILVGVLLINAVLFIAWALRKGAVDAGRKPPLFAPRWSLVDVWVSGQGIMILLVGMVLVAAIGAAVVGLVDEKTFQATATGQFTPGLLCIVLLSLIPQNALLIAFPVFFITQKYRVPLRQIGLPRLPSRREWRFGLKAGFAMLLLGIALELGLTGLMNLLLPDTQMQRLTEMNKELGNEGFLRSVNTPGLFLLLLFTGGLCAPVGEEIFFRGFLYNAAKRRLGLIGGTALSALFFALVHVAPIQVIAIFPVGILLAVMYERTGSLWVPIIMHAVNNSIGITLTYLFPGT